MYNLLLQGNISFYIALDGWMDGWFLIKFLHVSLYKGLILENVYVALFHLKYLSIPDPQTFTTFPLIFFL